MSKNAIGVALVLTAGLTILSGCAVLQMPSGRAEGTPSKQKVEESLSREEESLSREEALDILARNGLPPEVEGLVRVRANILMKLYAKYGLSYRDAFIIAAHPEVKLRPDPDISVEIRHR